MNETDRSKHLNRLLNEQFAGKRTIGDPEDDEMLHIAERLADTNGLALRSRRKEALRRQLLDQYPRRNHSMSRLNSFVRNASFAALIALLIAGLGWLLGNSGPVPAALPTATAASAPPTPEAGPTEPAGAPAFSPFPGAIDFAWVDGPIAGFFYADISSGGQPLGTIDFGSIQGGWCDRSADGGVLAFVHENIRSLGAAGIATEPAALQWLTVQDLALVHMPFPDMQVMNPPAFAPDGYRLAFAACPADGNCGLFVFDLETGELDRISPYQPTAPVLWSPDGTQLAFSVQNGDRAELHVISARTGQTDFIGRENEPASPLSRWGRPLPTGVNGVERCETTGADLPTPLGMDSDSETIRLRLLYSHTFWQSMWVDARLDDFNGAAAASSQRVQIWLDQPAKARVLSGPLDGAPGLLWISDGELTRLGEEVRIEPFDPPEIVSEVVYPHPMTYILPTPLSSLLFPSGLAQRGGTYTPVAVEALAGREALVVDWLAPWGDVVDRFWIDTVTGVILRDQNYGKGSGGAMTSDNQVTAISYTFNPQPETYNRLAAFPPAFAEGPEDIFSAAPVPAAAGEPDLSPAEGEIYLMLVAPGGMENAALVHFPASCLVTEQPCPQASALAETPAGFGYSGFNWSPDLTKLVYPVNTLADEIWVFDRTTSAWTKLDAPYMSGIVWSPDGTRLAGQPPIYGNARSNPILVASLGSLEWDEHLANEPGYKSPFGWADVTSILFVNTLDNEISDDDPFVYSEIDLYDVDSGQVNVLTGVRSNANTSQFRIPVLSPDRTRFAYAITNWQAGSTQVVVYDLATRAETAFTLDRPGGISWAPDGAHLLLTAALGYTCEIRLAAVDGSGERLLYSGDWGGGCQASWSPDGAYLLVMESPRDPTVPRLTVVVVATGEARTVSLPDVGVAFESLQAAWLP